MAIGDRTKRLSYEDSCYQLHQLELIDLDNGVVPPMPKSLPQFDDSEPLGVQFFRTIVSETELENLSLPRTFLGRSEVTSVSFQNTDLSESNFCWNDFNEVNFEAADLSNSDLRASAFQQTKFVGSDLRNADFRHSIFKSCDFEDARMDGVKLTRQQGQQLRLSSKQRAVIAWQETAGEEPRGG